jgi:type I restriction enzyme S subunit
MILSEVKNIPKHWQIKKLGEECKCVTGTTPPKNDPHNYGNDIPFVKPPQIFDKQINDAPEKLSNKGAALARILPINCVLVTCIGNLGRTAINKIPVAFNQQINAIIPSDRIDGKFLFYQAQSTDFRNQLEALSAATTVAIVNKGKFETIRIVIPPLAEQFTIVSKIEELLSDLDNGKQQLQIAQQQLKVYRQSLLKWAFEGKLTYKNERDGELPKGWKSIQLNKVCNKIQDGSHFSPQVQYDGPGENRFMYITAKNIRNDYMDFRKLTFVDKDFHDSIYGRCNPEYGDVLLTKDGINTGEVTLNTLHDPISLLSSVCIFKTKKNLLISSYLKYFIQSPFGNKAILDSMTGTAIKRIVLRKIKDAYIILPSIEEQQLIVDKLESKLSVCNKIEETINQSLLQAETLRQSILKKAFEGKLVSLNYDSDDKLDTHEMGIAAEPSLKYTKPD